MKNLRVLRLFALVALFCTMLSFEILAQKTNFSGTWKFNEGKSQLGENNFRRPNSVVKLVQDETSLVADFTRANQNGEETTTTEKYTLDGKECENSSPMRTKKSAITFSQDGKSMTINTTMTMEREGNKMEFKTTEVYKLSEDGKTLTIENTSNSQFGETKTTIVYDKAS